MAKIPKDQPEQIAFYVWRLAICLAKKQSSNFKYLWNLLQERNFREVRISYLKHILLSLFNFLEDKYSILRFFKGNNLLDKITEEVKERINLN